MLLAGDQLGLFDVDEAVVDELDDADLRGRPDGRLRWSRPSRGRRWGPPATDKPRVSGASHHRAHVLPGRPRAAVGAAAERLVATPARSGRAGGSSPATSRIGRDELDLVGDRSRPAGRAGRRRGALARAAGLRARRGDLDHRKRAALRRAIGALLGPARSRTARRCRGCRCGSTSSRSIRARTARPSVRHHRGIRP